MPYQQLERLRIRIEAELEERREAGERSHESAVEVLESYAATSARAIVRLIESGALPAIRLSAQGGSVRITDSDLRTFLEARRTAPKPEAEED